MKKKKTKKGPLDKSNINLGAVSAGTTVTASDIKNSRGRERDLLVIGKMDKHDKITFKARGGR